MNTRMTASMQISLMERLAELDDRIEELDQETNDGESVDRTALRNQLTRERHQIGEALDQATIIDDAPFDEHAIEVGDTVTVRDISGETERFVLVDGAVGARVRADWLSSLSPLGAALIGRSRGEEVAVETPVGLQRFVVLDFERSRLADGEPSPAA